MLVNRRMERSVFPSTLGHCRIVIASLALAVSGGWLPSPAAEPVTIGDGLHTGALPASSRVHVDSNTCGPFVTADPDWYVWGGSVIRGEDGRYHMFGSRWPRVQAGENRGMRGWLYVSEIAHYTADQPQGPYAYESTVLKGFDDCGHDRWDSRNAHNPCITRMKDPDTGKLRYYLYFVANQDDDRMSRAGEEVPPAFRNDWWDRIITQRPGVAVADSLDGPWTRHEAPVIAPPNGPLRHYLTNPGVVQLPDGTFLMCLKGRSEGKNYGGMIHGWALAKRPEGPFVAQDSLLFPGSVLAEDPCVWIHGGFIYAAVKDWNGTLSGVPGIARVRAQLSGTGGIPAGGLTWEVPADASLSARKIRWDDGTETPLEAIERPCVLLDEQGEPSHLFTAASLKSPFAPGNLPFNLCQPLERLSPEAWRVRHALDSEKR